MSYKENQKDPGRRQRILDRRKKYEGQGTDAAAYFKGHRYVPGNGPNHKLGRKA